MAEYKQLQTKMETIDVEGRTVRAIVSTGDLDAGNDIIMPTAFVKSLSTPSIRKRIKMLWQHKVDVVIGKPLNMEVMSDGSLLTETYISKIQKGEDYLTQAKEGIIDEFSIGFGDTVADYNEKGNRQIHDLTLMEYSAVTWGMNENTQTLGIKAINEPDARVIERVLREAGFSVSQAKAMANAGVKCLREVDQQVNDAKAMDEIKQAIAELNQKVKGI